MLHKGPDDLEKWNNRSGMKLNKEEKSGAMWLGTWCCKLNSSIGDRKMWAFSLISG